jgi:hypothetical protein
MLVFGHPIFPNKKNCCAMPDIKEKIIPPQRQGGKKDIEHTVTAVDDDDARKLFVTARNRLLDVNNWHNISSTVSAKFHLTDANGKEVDRTAEKNDYFKIALPAPGPAAGKGFDWVVIEAIEEKSDTSGPYESIGVRVRPASDPAKKGENVAHFFDSAATSTFLVERDGKTVSACVFGRNEKPNTKDTDNIVDKVRNALVGGGAIAGLSNIQWKSLVTGLIAMKKD